MSTTAPKNYDDVLARIRGHQSATKSAKDNSQLNNPKGDNEAITGIKDPADKGTVTPPDHPDGDSASKKNLPENAKNESHEGQDLTDKDTDPASTGKNVPSFEDGKKKEDAATSPTTPIDKIAGAVDNVLTRISALQGKSAAAGEKEGDKSAAAADAKKADAAAGKDAGNKEAANQLADDIQLTPEFHFKLATEILKTEDGVKFAERVLKESVGEKKAGELIDAALKAQDAFLIVSQQHDEQLKAASEIQAAGDALVTELLKNASVEDRTKFAKFKAAHTSVLATLPGYHQKAAFMQGAMDGAAMTDAAPAPEGGAPGGEMGAPAPEIPGGGDAPLSDEEVLALLEEMVASGEIPQEVAAQLVAKITGGGDPAAAGADPLAGAGGDPAMGALPEDAPPEAKAASELARKLLAAPAK